MHFLRQSQNSQIKNGAIEIPYQDYLLFNRLKKMIDACVKMECLGCHQLVPTIQFYEHLIDSDGEDLNPQASKLCHEHYHEHYDQISDYNNETRQTYPGIGSSTQLRRGFEARSKSVGRKSYATLLQGSRQFLNQSAELTDELSSTSFKQKYLNALSIIN